MSARSNQSNSTTLSSCTVKSNPSKIRLNFKLDSPEEMERKTRNLMRSSRKYKPSFFGVSEDNMYRRVKVKHEPPYRPESMMRIIHRKTPSTPGSPLRHKTNSTLQKIFSLSYEAEHIATTPVDHDSFEDFVLHEEVDSKRPSTSCDISQPRERMLKLHNYLADRREQEKSYLRRDEIEMQQNIEELELQIVQSAGAMPCTSENILERVRNRKQAEMQSEREKVFWKKKFNL